MTFLNPAILFGLFAASIPILIHLLNLRKLKKIEFSTLSFLKELQKTKIRKLKLKQWLLLALRILIILLLVAAFARPTVETVSLSGVSSTAKTTAVFILDNSFSMSLVQNEGSRFNQSKKIISSILNDFQEGDEAALILTSSINKDTKATENLSVLSKKIEESEISYVRGNITEAIEKGMNYVSSSPNFNKEIYLLTDLQSSNLVIDSLLTDFKDIGEESNVSFYLIPFNGGIKNNIAVTKIESRDQIFELNKKISFEANISNYGSNNVNSLIASLFINGKRKAQQSVDLKPDETRIVTFETVLENTGLLEVSVEIEDDDILYDNSRFFSFYVPDKISVLLLAENVNDAKFLDAALNHNSSGYMSVSKKNIKDLYSTSLSDYDVIILVGSLKDETNLLNEYVSNGGKLMVFPSSVPSQNFSPGLFSRLESNIKTSFSDLKNNTIEFDKVEFNHPIFLNVFENLSKVEIESPEISKYYKTTESGLINPIITLTDNSIFMGEIFIQKGSIIYFGVSPMLNWSDFPVKNIFAPLINKSVYYLSSSAENYTDFFTGTPLNINVHNARKPQIKIIDPRNREQYLTLDSLQYTKFITFNNTALAGVYKFFSDEKLLDFAVVNTDPEESQTKIISPIDFKESILDNNPDVNLVIINPNEDIQAVINQTRFGSELWRLFLIFAMITAIIEMLISKNSKKEMKELGNIS